VSQARSPVVDVEAPSPHESRWRLGQGDEIVPGRSAIRLRGGGLRYEAYLAWDDHLQSLVVVKLVRPELVEDAHTLDGLASEVEMLARLQHPVIVRGFDAQLAGPRPHVVLEHLEGPRLSSLLRRYGPLPHEQLLPLGVQLCAAAPYVAAEGVVHLDIKPSNIIMGAPARLIDLSVALTVADCRRLRSAVGTDAYMSREQCRPRDGAPVGPAADVWGIGVTLYHAMVGRRPFEKGDSEANEPSRRWPQLVDPPAPFDDGVPRGLADPIMACLAREPDDRPTPVELLAQLELLLDTLPKPWLSKLKPRRRRR
jgi:serine/threonine protein kinase